ncbi:hypothetical protein Tco_0322674 [Tanacetum coccineum]
MLAQFGNQGNVRNQNGNVVNENVQENVGNVIVNGNWVGCLYKEFLACNPKEYDGKGGVVVLTRWIEKMKSVQDMSGCSVDQKVKYTAASFVGNMKGTPREITSTRRVVKGCLCVLRRRLAPTVLGQVAKFPAVSAFWCTRTVMVEVTLGTSRFSPTYCFSFTDPGSMKPALYSAFCSL